MENNISLRNIDVHDTYFLFTNLKEKTISNAIIGLPNKVTLDDCRKQIQRMKKTNYIICYKKKPVGLIGYENNMLGYWITKEYRNKGICSIAVSQLIKKYPKKKFFANPINAQSMRVLEKNNIPIAKQRVIQGAKGKELVPEPKQARDEAGEVVGELWELVP